MWNSAGAAAGPVIAGIIAGRFGYRTTFALVWLLMISRRSSSGGPALLGAVPILANPSAHLGPPPA